MWVAALLLQTNLMVDIKRVGGGGGLSEESQSFDKLLPFYVDKPAVFLYSLNDYLVVTVAASIWSKPRLHDLLILLLYNSTCKSHQLPPSFFLLLQSVEQQLRALNSDDYSNRDRKELKENLGFMDFILQWQLSQHQGCQRQFIAKSL